MIPRPTPMSSVPVPRSPTPPHPDTVEPRAMSDNPAIKALTLALRDNASDLTEQAKAVVEAQATLKAAQMQMTTLRGRREGLQAALAVLRGERVAA